MRHTEDRIPGRVDRFAQDDLLGRAAKRGFDLSVALLLLPMLAPIILVLYLATRAGGGPGFFGHARIGRHGRAFRCWKIRTMVPDAEAVLAAHLAADPAAAREWAASFKLAADPRITRLGRILRETSLDELPQIVNVLRGEMSFVGPRPVTAVEMARYRGYEWCYLSGRPGITGLWQVSGRNDVDYDARVRLDVEYSSSRTLLMDIAILWRTIGAVLNATGR
ncbi:Undecaprenyl phosphate N,N'-diacetylbacillosamine 1-phosphate transferase [Roseivivax jejudonensis]|uniref:Undecaprenyl phosphate N,N'-diacetylbacillosamine 1-phosphate transferase n=1 Tax=Roseivivax jejudonensis TaxID=1529041 RepID=A0A1X6ZKG8_9RHOB|nr:sugar transferase [Roseivivax jejudonensis]SLN53384.1 Undecaprenyl phosphate N,N'-diacetylbacillosamine 1-phosphate transferase [Roseivivax jejudonensis]